MGESTFYFHKDGNRWSDMKLTGQSNAMFNNMERISCLCGAELHFFFFFLLIFNYCSVLLWVTVVYIDNVFIIREI